MKEERNERSGEEGHCYCRPNCGECGGSDVVEDIPDDNAASSIDITCSGDIAGTGGGIGGGGGGGARRDFGDLGGLDNVRLAEDEGSGGGV